MLAAAREHLSSRGQPDTLTAHFEYPGRTSAGPAIIVIEDIKAGRQVSTLHLTLWQGPLLSHAPWIEKSASRRSILAYATCTNLRNWSGFTIPTAYEATPVATLPPLPDFKTLKIKDADGSWERSQLPNSSALLNSLRNWCFYLPHGEPPLPGVLDMWIRMASGERITQRTLPYVVDSFPLGLHTLLAAPELRALMEPPRDKAKKSGGKTGKEKPSGSEENRASLWFPTVNMNLEVKMALPEEGVEWLAMRITCRQIKDGRFDLDVQVRTVEGELVASSNQLAMILTMERNMAKKGTSAKAVL